MNSAILMLIMGIQIQVGTLEKDTGRHICTHCTKSCGIRLIIYDTG